MNGIKLGEDMVEGKVVLNGTARTILEIKTKDGVVWPKSHVYTYTLDNLVLHYSAGTYLRPTKSNYAYLTADYKTYEDGVLINTQNVTCTPNYSKTTEAIITSGNYLYWDKDRYGSTYKAQDYVNAKGTYSGITTSASVRVGIGANTSSSSYEYRKTFSMDNIGNIPAEGATYNFIANSYRTETVSWTSGITQELAETAYESAMSAVPDTVNISKAIIEGTETGTVTIPANTSSERSITIRMYSGDGYTNFTYTQSAADTYAFFLDSASSDTQQFEYGADSVDLGIFSTKNGSYFGDISVSTLPSWCHVSYVRDGSTSKIKLTISVDSNTGTDERATSIVLTQNGGDSKTITISVTQLAEHAHYMRLVPSASPQYIQPLQSIVFSVETDSPYWVATYRIPLGWNVTEDHTDNTIEVYLEEGAMAVSFSFQITGDDTPTVQMQVLAT